MATAAAMPPNMIQKNAMRKAPRSDTVDAAMPPTTTNATIATLAFGTCVTPAETISDTTRARALRLCSYTASGKPSREQP